METITIQTPDQVSLTARRYAPAGAARAVVLIPAAMGVRQQFYAAFAGFLAEHGMAVLTFDYRGMGESLPTEFAGSLRGFQADLNVWAERDYDTALQAARQWQPGLPLLVIGHSLGGQLAGLTPSNHLIDGMLTVGCGTGYWRYNAPQLRRYVWLLWYVLAPLYTAVCGYFPGKKMRKVGNLPKGVIRQWTRWCKHRHYFVDESGAPMQTYHHQFRSPILCMSFTDDEMMGRRNIDSLHDHFSAAQIERLYIKPSDVNARRIGHFGFFRPEFRHSLWQQALQWLAATPGASRA